MRGGWWGIDLSRYDPGHCVVMRDIESNNVRGTLALRLSQGPHCARTVGVQVAFEDRSNNSVWGPEKHLWKPCLTCGIGLISRESGPLYGHLTARAISRPPNERNCNDLLR